MTEPLPPEDPRDALIREQAALLKEQAEQIAALTALVAELREQRDAARMAATRNSGNSSMPPSADDLPGRRPPARKERRVAERAEQKRGRGKQPGSPGTAMRWRRPDEVVPHFPEGACACGLDLAGAADLGVFRSYQQEDVPEPQPSRRYQHDLHRARCTCGRVHAAPRPAGVPDASLSTGPRLSALAVYGTVFQHVPVQRAQLLIADLAGSALSAGFVHAGHQACAAHLLRDLQECAESYPASGWPEQAMRALRALIRAWHAARDHDLPAVPDDVRSPLELEFRRAVTVGLAAVRRIPGPRTAVRQQPGRELLEFCRDHEGDVLRFARDTSIWRDPSPVAGCSG